MARIGNAFDIMRLRGWIGARRARLWILVLAVAALAAVTVGARADVEPDSAAGAAEGVSHAGR